MTSMNDNLSREAPLVLTDGGLRRGSKILPGDYVPYIQPAWVTIFEGMATVIPTEAEITKLLEEKTRAEARSEALAEAELTEGRISWSRKNDDWGTHSIDEPNPHLEFLSFFND